MTENEISDIIRGKIVRIFTQLGPGLLESVYSAALYYELTKSGLLVRKEVPIPFIYDDIQFDVGYRMDMLVENKVLIEIKSIEQIHEVHHKQVITYLKLAGIKLGLLVNFNTNDILKSIFRKVNGL